MRRGISILAIASLAGLATTAEARDIKMRFEFAFPLAGSCADAADGCTPWDGSGLATYARELHPVVPVRIVHTLLPRGYELDAVEVVTSEPRTLPYVPRIAAEQRPLTPGVTIERSVPKWTARTWPQAWHGEPMVRKFRGFAIVDLPVYPLRMSDARTALYVDSMTVVVKVRPAPKRLGESDDEEALRPVARDYAEAAAGADNTSMLEVHPVPPSEEIGYLILGPRALIGSDQDTPLEPLISIKERRNMHVSLVALEDAVKERTPKAIRDYIRTSYKHLSVDYVLLVGDHDRLPWKYVRSGVSDHSDPVPSDQYYACLDGEFDSPPAIDWACEVAVGRIGARSRDDVAAWVEKAVALDSATRAGRTTKFLSYGEKLDGRTLGSRTLQYLISGREQAPKTVGFPAAINVKGLFDTFSQEVSASAFLQELNAGDYHVVNHLGHANETYVLRMNASDLTRMKSRPAFFYSEGCYPNDPDKDNWTIRAVRMPDYGPAAMIANTRYGWYAPGDVEEGTSSVLHRTFWSRRFASGDKTIGVMNHRAKAQAVAADGSSLMIYTALESNLIGDPDLDLGL